MENQSFSEYPLTVGKMRSHVVVFTSGKSGIGKSSITLNVATALAKRGTRVCVFDAGDGLNTLTGLLGYRPGYALEQVLNGEKSIRDVTVKTLQGVSIVPAASAMTESPHLDDTAANRLHQALVELENNHDYILIDTATGASDSVLQFIESAPYSFLLITPDPATLTDGFSLLKSLDGRHYPGRIRVIVNMAADYPQATETYRRFAAAVDQYLQLAVDYGGFVANDDNMPQAAAKHTPLVNFIDNSPASRCLTALADNLLKYIGSTVSEIGLADYWQVALKTPHRFLADNLITEPATAITLEPQPASTQPQTAPAIGQALLAALHSQTHDQAYFEAFTADYLSAFQAQYGHYPDCFKTLLFRWLEAEDYAAPQLQELAGTLEMLYMSKHQYPMYSLESCTARLIAQCKESEAQMRDLIAQFRTAYRQAFQTDVFDAGEEVVKHILNQNFQESDFQPMLDRLNAAFEQRFHRPYQNPKFGLLKSAVENLTEMAAEEKKLQQQIDTLLHSVNGLNQRREYLLKTLQQP